MHNMQKSVYWSCFTNDAAHLAKLKTLWDLASISSAVGGPRSETEKIRNRHVETKAGRRSAGKSSRVVERVAVWNVFIRRVREAEGPGSFSDISRKRARNATES